MANSVQDILRLIRDEEIQMVDFKMVDIHGQFRHVTIPAENFSEDMMTDGVGFDASNYGYAVVEKSDMVFIPSSTTPRTGLSISTPGTSSGPPRTTCAKPASPTPCWCCRSSSFTSSTRSTGR